MHGNALRVSGLTTALAIILSLPTVFGLGGGVGLQAPVAPAAVEPAVAQPPPLSLLSPHPAEPARDPSAKHIEAKRRAPALLVHVRGGLIVRASPNPDARQIGTMPASSKYYHVPLVAWIRQVSANGRWGEVEIPYTWPQREGWIFIAGLGRDTTRVSVEVDLSQHRVTVTQLGHRLFSTLAAIGAPSTPTPPGRYFVTDRVPFSAGSSYGLFAFGISGIQPHLPPGWGGGDQLAIHGTNDPGSIGHSVSAGCVRVPESPLERLESLLRLGTPVVIHS